jgi:Family of unknown function (DUF6502)
MLANNLSYTFAIDLLKTLFVEVADQEFTIDHKRQTDSRISLMSGVHRKDVKRLREQQPDVEDVMPGNVSLGSQLIALWNADEKYLNAEGLPKPLPRFADAKDSASKITESFESLVRSVSTDIHPRAVLDEWLRLGVAKLDKDNFVHLTTDLFIAQEGFEEKVFYLGHNLHDHAQAAIFNVLGQQPNFLERCVHYNGLTKLNIEEIAQTVNKHGMKLLREVNKTADVLDKSNQQSARKPKPSMRMTMGLYYYYEAEQEPADEK